VRDMGSCAPAAVAPSAPASSEMQWMVFIGNPCCQKRV
jgi:hypothetical protein